MKIYGYVYSAWIALFVNFFLFCLCRYACMKIKIKAYFSKAKM